MIDTIVSALLAVRVQITKYETTKPTITPQVRQVDSGRESKANPPRNTTTGESGTSDEKAQVIQEIHRVFREKASEAESIARCENSTFNPKAVGHNSNGSRDYSIFQINDIHFKKIPGSTYSDKVAYITDPYNNIRFAYELFKQQGFNPWVCKYVLALK